MMANEPTATDATNRTRFVIDAAERTLATAAQAAIGEVIVLTADWPQWVVVPLMAGLAVVKAWLARFSGKSDSASLAPRV